MWLCYVSDRYSIKKLAKHQQLCGCVMTQAGIQLKILADEPK
jgi:hypothetical protein